MQFTLKLSSLSAFFTLFTASFASPITDSSNDPNVQSADQLRHWLATTDADITYIGKPINPLTSRQLLESTVTFCTFTSGNICGGSCQVVTSEPQCVEAAGTACLAATSDVSFCDKDQCQGSCNQLSSCGTKLDGGFCATPGTKSIAISAAA